jgi:dTDP-4-dehydrorhamnose reductase
MNNQENDEKRRKTVLVTGSNGQLAKEIQFSLNKITTDNQINPFQNWKFIFANKKILDISNDSEVEDFFEKNSIDFCINCAAYTNVDEAEKNKKLAEKINVFGPKILAQKCQKNDAILIHISTDYVFSGQNYRPYQETDLPNPVNFYGETKLKGENLIQTNNPKSIIIRTSWLYSKTFGKNFFRTISNLAKKQEQINIVVDQIGTPTNARDLAQIILEIVLKINIKALHKVLDSELYFGIYHFSNFGVCSWYDFGVQIVDNLNLNCQVLPINSWQYPTLAKRPYFSVLDKTKIQETFGLKIRNWRDALKN